MFSLFQDYDLFYVFVTLRLYIKSIEYHTMKSSMIYAPYVPLSLTHAHTHTYARRLAECVHVFFLD